MKILQDGDGCLDILPDGCLTQCGGTKYSCKISELIAVLNFLKDRYGDAKIGIYDSFEKGYLLKIHAKNLDEVIVRMSNYN